MAELTEFQKQDRAYASQGGLCQPDTLYITHVFDGEEVVRGGITGQVWVATFASAIAAEHFIRYCVEHQKTFAGREP